jgi:hypothetical protein
MNNKNCLWKYGNSDRAALEVPRCTSGDRRESRLYEHRTISNETSENRRFHYKKWPQQLSQYLHTKSYRLGHAFEALVSEKWTPKRSHFRRIHVPEAAAFPRTEFFNCVLVPSALTWIWYTVSMGVAKVRKVDYTSGYRPTVNKS